MQADSGAWNGSPVDVVTADWLSELLHGEVSEVRHHRIGDGLVGMNLRVELIDATPELPDSVVIKLPSTDPTSRMTGVMLRNYEREVKFYLHVAGTVDIRVPHCHHASWDEASGDFVIVLEDMSPAEQGNQITGCDATTAERAVAELARLHGPRWDDPTLTDLDWLGRRTGPDDVAQLEGLWQMFFPGFSAIYRPHMTDEQFALAEAFGAQIGPWMEGRTGPETVTHGDYRLDNMLFATPAGGPPVTVVDWQTPGHGAPIGDLAYFLGAGLMPPDRRANERHLLDVYGSVLADSYSVDVDEAWLSEQYRREAFGGVVMAVVASQIVGTSDRSEAMFAAMATRHCQHAIDLDSLAEI